MKPITLLVCIAFLVPIERASATKLELIGGRVSDVRFALYQTTFPVKFRQLFDRIGGEDVLDWQGGFSSGREKPRHFEVFAIRGVDSKDGSYQLEVEFADEAKDLFQDRVKMARVRFVSDYGIFYAEDLSVALGPWGMEEIKERKTGEPGATDNPDDAQRLREDH